MVEVAKLKTFEPSITLMRMGMIKKKDIRESAKLRCAQWRLNRYIGERMLKMELLGRERKPKRKIAYVVKEKMLSADERKERVQQDGSGKRMIRSDLGDL